MANAQSRMFLERRPEQQRITLAPGRLPTMAPRPSDCIAQSGVNYGVVKIKLETPWPPENTTFRLHLLCGTFSLQEMLAYEDDLKHHRLTRIAAPYVCAVVVEKFFSHQVLYMAVDEYAYTGLVQYTTFIRFVDLVDCVVR